MFRSLRKANAAIERHMPLVTPSCLVVGVLFSSFFIRLQVLVPWLFAVLTFTGSLNSRFRDLKNVLWHPLSLLVTLLLLHVWMPLTALLAGRLFFGGSPYLVTGMVLEFTVPTAVVSLIWVSIYRGNSALSLSVILVDTLLSPFVTPLSLKVLVGSAVRMDPVGMIRDLALMIALPALLAMALNECTRGKAKTTLAPNMGFFSKLCLMLVVASNSSKIAPFLYHMTPTLFAVALAILLLAASGYAWGFLCARLFRRGREDAVSLTFGSGMRNITAGAVIAAQYFPAEVMFPVMIGTVFQQVLAAVSGWLLSKLKK